MGEVLSVAELLEKTYWALEKRAKHKTIIFPKPALTEIADDSDWHRTRTGYMKYKQATLFKLDGGEWAVALGRACGSYPADPYDTDLSAIKCTIEGKLEEQIEEEIMSGFRRSVYFTNSLVYGMSDGSLAINQRSKLGNKILEIIRPEIENYMAKKPEYHDRFMTMDLRPAVTARAEYKPEFADFLAESIIKVLSENAKK
ncbi:MAG: hypothetical protein ABIH63_00035 [archaeon]